MSRSKSPKPRAPRARWLDRLRSFFRRPAAPPTLHQVVGKAGSRGGAAHLLKALKAVLDRHHASRAVLAHLSVVEQALEHRGVAGLEDVPADVLARALTQLEMVVADWSEAGIAALRAQLKAAMARPAGAELTRGTRATAAAKAPAKASTEFDNSRLQVNEASVSTFMEARARWETSLTGGR